MDSHTADLNVDPKNKTTSNVHSIRLLWESNLGLDLKLEKGGLGEHLEGKRDLENGGEEGKYLKTIGRGETSLGIRPHTRSTRFPDSALLKVHSRKRVLHFGVLSRLMTLHMSGLLA